MALTRDYSCEKHYDYWAVYCTIVDVTTKEKAVEMLTTYSAKFNAERTVQLLKQAYEEGRSDAAQAINEVREKYQTADRNEL